MRLVSVLFFFSCFLVWLTQMGAGFVPVALSHIALFTVALTCLFSFIKLLFELDGRLLEKQHLSFDGNIILNL